MRPNSAHLSKKRSEALRTPMVSKISNVASWICSRSVLLRNSYFIISPFSFTVSLPVCLYIVQVPCQIEKNHVKKQNASSRLCLFWPTGKKVLMRFMHFCMAFSREGENFVPPNKMMQGNFSLLQKCIVKMLFCIVFFSANLWFFYCCFSLFSLTS